VQFLKRVEIEKSSGARGDSWEQLEGFRSLHGKRFSMQIIQWSEEVYSKFISTSVQSLIHIILTG
jgi:hypothetical protein